MRKLQEKKYEKGITLVALVVTIVVLLILAGVSISTVIGDNGIITKAKEAETKTNEGQAKDEMSLVVVEYYVSESNETLEEFLKSKIPDRIDKVTNNNGTLTIVKDGYTLTVDNVDNSQKDNSQKEDKLANQIVLSANSDSYVYPNGGTVTVTGNPSGGKLTVSTDNSNIASASINGNTITITPGTTAGTAVITIKSAATDKYEEGTVTYRATVQNGEISLSVTTYDGKADGTEHDAITSVSVEPNDAIVEYSTDGGTTFSTTIPKIKDSATVTIKIRASKAGYNTKTIEETLDIINGENYETGDFD